MANGTNEDAILDVVEEQIARTYAQGFLGAAGDNNVAELVADLIAIRDEVLKPHPRFLETLSSAFLDHDQRIAMIDKVLAGKVNAIVTNLVKVLSEHGRIGILGSVATQVEKLHNESLGRVEVLVRLAHQADAGLLKQIEDSIRQKTGLDPVVRIEIDADLIGGLEVRIGDTVYDGSVRTAFAKAHKTIVQQTIEAIENEPERFTVAS